MAIIVVTQIIVFILRGWMMKTTLFLCLYVNDMLVARSNMDHIKGLKCQLAHAFSMKDLGAAKQLLGIKICRDRKNRTLMLS